MVDYCVWHGVWSSNTLKSWTSSDVFFFTCSFLDFKPFLIWHALQRPPHLYYTRYWFHFASSLVQAYLALALAQPDAHHLGDKQHFLIAQNNARPSDGRSVSAVCTILFSLYCFHYIFVSPVCLRNNHFCDVPLASRMAILFEQSNMNQITLLLRIK